MTDATDIFNNSYETEGQGVGVILRDNGKQLIILTEKNVVDKADKLSVTFVNDMMADAALVKYDSNTGIAIISVDKSLLDDATIRAIAVAELGNSNIVSRGASVIALEANYAILTGLVTSICTICCLSGSVSMPRMMAISTLMNRGESSSRLFSLAKPLP